MYMIFKKKTIPALFLFFACFHGFVKEPENKHPLTTQHKFNCLLYGVKLGAMD